MNRRDFLKLFGLGTLSVLAGGEYKTANANEQLMYGNNTTVSFPSEKKIDFHCHAILPSYIRGMEKLGIDSAAEEGYPLPKWTLDEHLKFMSDAHIDYSVLSMPTPHIYRGNEGLSAKVSREINEEMAKLCREHSDKFGFVATLPTPCVKSSLEEIRYAMDELDALGVKVPSNSYGVYLGDPSMDEIFAELDRRKALVILHPSPAKEVPRKDVITGRVMALYEYPTDTTRALLNLLANGTLEHFQNIRLVAPHTGSFLPYMKSRANAMFQLLAARGMIKPIDIEKSIGRLYFDLAGDPMPDEMDMLLKITDKEHIVYGSDYPYVLPSILLKKKAALDKELTKRNQMKQVYVDNAKKLIHAKIF